MEKNQYERKNEKEIKLILYSNPYDPNDDHAIAWIPILYALLLQLLEILG